MEGLRPVESPAGARGHDLRIGAADDRPRPRAGTVERSSAVALTGTAYGVGSAVTVLIVATPYVAFGYHNPSLHLVVNSIEACVALLVAYLVYGRFIRRSRLQDLLLAQGLLCLAVANMALTFGSDIWRGVPAGTSDIWYPVAIRLLGASLIVAAALADDRVLATGISPQLLFLGPVASVAVIFTILWIAKIEQPVAFDRSYVPSSAQYAFLTGHWLLIAAQIAAAASFLIGSVLFTRASVRRDDQLLRWLGPACALGGFARVNYVLFPSLYTDWIYTGDLLRFGCYLLLLIGATREIRQYWAAQAGVAVLDDRRRLARELHDGVIQELVLIRMEGQALPDGPAGDRIVRACDRALDEARAALQALGYASDEPLGTVLRRAAGELAERLTVEVVVDLDDSITVDHDQQHALVRIAREAMMNAVRHGEAARIDLRLTKDGDDRYLVIEDNGRGFDPSGVPAASAGYGLVSMRDRAAALPGSLNVESRLGSGTRVTVKW